MAENVAPRGDCCKPEETRIHVEWGMSEGAGECHYYLVLVVFERDCAERFGQYIVLWPLSTILEFQKHGIQICL